MMTLNRRDVVVWSITRHSDDESDCAETKKNQMEN